jgi:hypothetical protein
MRTVPIQSASIAFALIAGQVVRAEIRDCRSLELQKRKRDPAVVAMLFRARKPLASPPLSEVDMTPR